MEPPRGALASIWSLIRFLPYFLGLLLLGTIKGIIFCPIICLITTIGNSAIIIGLWPFHYFRTNYCILRSKQLGLVSKIVLFISMPVPFTLWLVLGIFASFVGGAAYGFLSPIFATFDAVGVGKSNPFFHCFYDGTWSTVKGSVTIVGDFADFCYHSFISYTNEIRRESPDKKRHEIRLLYLPGAVIATVLCFLVDMPMISLIALYKSPVMLFKGWHRLLHDLIGREGPFLETICLPFAGLAILLWPLAVIGAVLGSIVSSIFFGAYAAAVVYQESSFWMGLRYIVASVAIYDEYSNDVLDMRDGSCFHRPSFRTKNSALSESVSFSKRDSFKKTPARTSSFKNTVLELNPLEMLSDLFEGCQHYGERLMSEGLITPQDIEDARSSSKGRGIVSIGLPSYCILQTLLRSIKANSDGILLRDGDTELTTVTRPTDVIFDWFLKPLLVLKDQIKSSPNNTLNVAEEDYLGKLVLFNGDGDKLKNSYIVPPLEPERRRAELDGLARRLRGITRSISRYPTFRRRFEVIMRTLSEDLASKHNGSRSIDGAGKISRSKSVFDRIFSQKSFKFEKSNNGSDQDSHHAARDIEISIP